MPKRDCERELCGIGETERVRGPAARATGERDPCSEKELEEVEEVDAPRR